MAIQDAKINGILVCDNASQYKVPKIKYSMAPTDICNPMEVCMIISGVAIESGEILIALIFPN